MTNAKIRSLSAADFDRLAERTKLGDVARAMARAYFVAGETPTEIAASYGTSPQRVTIAINSIHAAHAKGGDLAGPVWLRLHLDSIPAPMHDPLVAFIAELKKRHPAASKEVAVAKVVRALERATNELK